MNRWDHGGNIYEISRLLGCSPEEIIDLSASINPLGPPDGLRELLSEHFRRVRSYPDIHNRKLIEAISAFHDMSSDHVVVGNGSTEILYWIPYAFKLERAAIVLPTFSEYIRSLENKGVMIRTLTTAWENGFQPTVYQLETLIEAGHPQAVFLTNPGSPSGTPLSSDIREFLENNVGKSDLLWIIDEVFADFCEEYSVLDLVRSSRNVIVIRSLTKFYALPGLRLGYALAHDGLAQKLKSFIPPWSVNTFAQEAGCYCLSQSLFRERSLEFFRKERERLFELLQKLPSLSFLRTVANYILFKLEDDLELNAASLQAELLRKHKILVRNCENFRGLSDRFIRIAIASADVNDLWFKAFEEILGAIVERK